MERDNFMSPEEALKFGLIDRIITSRDEIKQEEKQFTLELIYKNYYIIIKCYYKWSKNDERK